MARRPEEVLLEQNPCLRCGACCIGYRASFYWAEGDDATQGGVPVGMTVRADAFRRAMRRDRQRRCVALRGTAGRRVYCAIYERRPSVCRGFEPAWKKGSVNTRCDEARARLGLSPIFHHPQEYRIERPARKRHPAGLYSPKSTNQEGIVSRPSKISR